MSNAKACAIILAGGRGTRISSLYPDLPKPMIKAAGQPFVEWVIRYLARQGLQRFVVSLGHLASVAEDYFAARPDDGLKIETVVEPSPMGTGGAFLLAEARADAADPLVVTNGDSLVLADLAGMWSLLDRPDVDGVVVGVVVPDTSRYGSLSIGTDGMLIGFREKVPGQGCINAGIYAFKRRVLSRFPAQRPISFETGVFPALLADGVRIAVHTCQAPFLDIGTPESVVLGTRFIETHFGA